MLRTKNGYFCWSANKTALEPAKINGMREQSGDGKKNVRKEKFAKKKGQISRFYLTKLGLQLTLLYRLWRNIQRLQVRNYSENRFNNADNRHRYHWSQNTELV
jgi:hypothetical protein